MEDDNVEVVMWRGDTIGVILRLWVKDRRGHVVRSCELLLEGEFLGELLSEHVAAKQAALQDVLF